MKLEDIKSVYFVGAGGIGMSALVRYFLQMGLSVGGYDRTATPLTHTLEQEGATLHYDDDTALIGEAFRHQEDTLVIYTPAIPKDHKELNYFRNEGFTIMKRAEVLGLLTHSLKGLCVAGTHGKTTTSTMAAHLLHESHVGCNAFLGGISKNYGTNYLASRESEYVVIEADEYDRSFHHLRPWASVVTATDADHLDIYGTEEAYIESFRKYTTLVVPGGALIVHTGLALKPAPQDGVTVYSYSREEGDFHAENIRIGNGEIVFDLVSPIEPITDIKLGVPVGINIENGIAAMALAQLAGATAEELRKAMGTFAGIERRFDFRIKTEQAILLSDYAHHPEEIRHCILSLREVFNGRRISVIFQPHLYSRTRDFYHEFADSLSLFDEVAVTSIYPARELPIEGVTSQLIYDNIKPGVEKHLIDRKDAVRYVQNHTFDVLVVLGAGDLDDEMSTFAEIIKEQHQLP